MDGKKPWLQIVTLVLCAALLAVTLWQGEKISELQAQTVSLDRRVVETAQNTRMAIQDLSSQMAEGEKLVRDWELAPAGMDQKTNSLLTEFSLNLKEWRADTEVCLTAHQGSGTKIVSLGGNGTGRFSGALPVSLEGKPLSLEVRVDSGGTCRQEELGGWDDVSMLLPVRLTGSGYGGPNYRSGVFSVDGYTVNLTDRDDTPAAVEEPAFYLRRNGETVWEAEGVPPEDDRAASGLSARVLQSGAYTPDRALEVECQPGDTAALFFTCRDEYGLKYTFSLESWEVSDALTHGYNFSSGGGSSGPMGEVRLSWD